MQLIGAGGAGTAIAVAVAQQGPRALRIHDIDTDRAQALAERVRRVNAAIEVSVGPASARDVDFLMNATPSGMLGDTALPLDPAGLAPSTVVFDAVVTPAVTPLLAHGDRVGCVTVYGREMMRGQIAKLVDFFTEAVASRE